VSSFLMSYICLEIHFLMSNELVIGKRALNKEKIRQDLIEQATRIFSEKGLDKTTVADIVTACDIARGTFYNYFTDVKDIFDEIVTSINEEIRQVTKEARQNEETLYDMLFNSFKAYFDLVSSPKLKGFHEKNQAYIRSASYKSDVIRRIVDELRTDVEKVAAKFSDDKTSYLLTYVLIGTPAELFLNNMSVNRSFQNDEVAKFLAELFTGGLKDQK